MAEVARPDCRRRDAQIAAPQRRVAESEATVRDLQARLGQNGSNSSVPPSANPPSAPPPVVKKPTGRRPGAQPGHPPAPRQLNDERVPTYIIGEVREGEPGVEFV